MVPEYSWLAPIGLIALFALAAIAWFLSKGQRKKAIENNLDKNGKKAVAFLRKSGGKMRQKTLEKKMKLSGPKYSKLLREMEELEAIKRLPGSRENTIELLI